jgi:hypothetical protein
MVIIMVLLRKDIVNLDMCDLCSMISLFSTMMLIADQQRAEQRGRTIEVCQRQKKCLHDCALVHFLCSWFSSENVTYCGE